MQRIICVNFIAKVLKIGCSSPIPSHKYKIETQEKLQILVEYLEWVKEAGKVKLYYLPLSVWRLCKAPKV